MTARRSGKVTLKQVAPGSKSARNAVVLEAADGDYILRRKNGNPFRDPSLEELVGKHVAVNGDIHGADLIISDWHELQDDDDIPPTDAGG